MKKQAKIKKMANIKIDSNRIKYTKNKNYQALRTLIATLHFLVISLSEINYKS